MTEGELARLLDVARRRPLLDALTVRRGKRKGQAVANVRPEIRERLEALGRERALIYKTLVLTGLRKGELASLTVGQIRLDGPNAYVDLDAADEKNREGNAVPIRADLADDLRAWLADKLADARQGRDADAASRFRPDFPADDAAVHGSDRPGQDPQPRLEAAGIPKRDDRGRTLDVHALRTTFGTLLSRAGFPCGRLKPPCGIPTPTSQRTSTPTRGCLDVHGALDALPTLPLDAGPDASRESLRATGTDDSRPGSVSASVSADRA